jgi:hypothetical protein
MLVTSQLQQICQCVALLPTQLQQMHLGAMLLTTHVNN